MKISIAKRKFDWYEVVVVDDKNNEHRQFFKEGDTMPIDEYIEIYNSDKTYKPNWFHRTMMRLCFGYKWENL